MSIKPKPVSQKFHDLSFPLSESEAQRIVHDEPELAIFLLIQLSKKTKKNPAAEAHTPSGATAPYLKANTQKKKRGKDKRKRKRGAKKGHAGSNRPTPEINKHQTHKLKKCPDCGKSVSQCEGETMHRFRIVEDIPHDLTPEVTEHRLNKAYCSSCKKVVEPKIPDALPGHRLGNRALSLIVALRYGIGVTLSQIVETFDAHLHFPLTSGGVVNSCHKVAEILRPWYDQIGDELRNTYVLNADETGWRVNGVTYWLWCLTCPTATYYTIESSRSMQVVLSFFGDLFSGILVADFWGAYNSLQCMAKQRCLQHLFRELKKINEQDDSAAWCAFHKKLKRLLNDALREKMREEEKGELSQTEKQQRQKRFKKRLLELIKDVNTGRKSKENPNVIRIVKRLRTYQDEIFTFLNYPGVPIDNNRGEREIRPAVILRKTSFGNQSDQGAQTQSILMSIYRTLKNRKLVPMDEIEKALRHYSVTGTVPPLPDPAPE